MAFDLEWKVSDTSVLDFVRLINLLENLISPFFKRKDKFNLMTYEIFQITNIKNLDLKKISAIFYPITIPITVRWMFIGKSTLQIGYLSSFK